MTIINKLFESREEELYQVTQKDRSELLNIYPEYCENSQLEELIEGNKTFESAFEKYCLKLSTENTYFTKKAYLLGLKDGLNIMKFAKGDDVTDC